MLKILLLVAVLYYSAPLIRASEALAVSAYTVAITALAATAPVPPVPPVGREMKKK